MKKISEKELKELLLVKPLYTKIKCPECCWDASVSGFARRKTGSLLYYDCSDFMDIPLCSAV